MATKKFTDTSDDKMDQKQGIKEGSKTDRQLDKKRGLATEEKGSGKKNSLNPFKTVKSGSSRGR